MSVNLLDRYLSSSRSFPRTMLQLAAAAAIFISSKIEGVLPHPRASRVAALSDGAFDLDRLIGFERVMCHSLGFDLYGPTTQNFLDMWLHALPAPVGEGEKFFVGKVSLFGCCSPMSLTREVTRVSDLPCHVGAFARVILA